MFYRTLSYIVTITITYSFVIITSFINIQFCKNIKSIFSLDILEDKCTIYRARRIDKSSRIFFPLSFGIFNLVFWIFYLYS